MSEQRVLFVVELIRDEPLGVRLACSSLGAERRLAELLADPRRRAELGEALLHVLLERRRVA